MNPEDVLVRIEKIAGNFPKKQRASILETIAEMSDKDSHQQSQPLTDDEIGLVRDTLRDRIDDDGGEAEGEGETGAEGEAAADTPAGETTQQIRPGEASPASGDKPHAEATNTPRRAKTAAQSSAARSSATRRR